MEDDLLISDLTQTLNLSLEDRKYLSNHWSMWLSALWIFKGGIGGKFIGNLECGPAQPSLLLIIVNLY